MQRFIHSGSAFALFFLVGCGGPDPEVEAVREQVKLFEEFQAFVKQHDFPKTYEEETGYTQMPIWGAGFTAKKWAAHTEDVRKADPKTQAPIKFLFDAPDRDRFLDFLERRKEHHKDDPAYAKAIETLKKMNPVPRETDRDYPKEGPLTVPLPPAE